MNVVFPALAKEVLLVLKLSASCIPLKRMFFRNDSNKGNFLFFSKPDIPSVCMDEGYVSSGMQSMTSVKV